MTMARNVVARIVDKPEVIRMGTGSVPGSRLLVRKCNTDEMRVYQDLANGSDFHSDVLSLSFQSLPCALWEGGAHVVRAATPL